MAPSPPRWSWLALLALAACPAGVGPPDAGPPPARYTVRVFAGGLEDLRLHWFDGEAWAPAPVPLQALPGWWTGTFSGRPGAQFSLQLGDGGWYPGGTTTYHPAPGTTWLKEGLLFPYDPTDGGQPPGQLTVLTVNLHTYQEAEPLLKLGWVAEVIARGEVDLVAFQECAQRRDTPLDGSHLGVNVRGDNMALLVVGELASRWGRGYSYFWDWSHYGFTFYEEGSAVLGRDRFALEGHQARYISNTTNTGDINARTAVLGAWQVPGVGRVHLFSTHVSWGGPQPEQLAALLAFAGEQADAGPVATLVAGDFNLDYGSDGYLQVVADGGWTDAFAEAAPGAERDPTLGVERIDYQFRSRASRLVPILAQRVFLQLGGPEAANQQVSDHLGVLVHYRLAP